MAKISKAKYDAASKVVVAYAKQEGKIAAKKAHKHGKAAAKVVSAKASQAFNFLKSKINK